MSIDLSQFHQVFFEESFEGLDIMESALMELDPEDIDSETINAIFRSAHSIKGGSATFGFTSVAEFTHVLETLLDEVRAGKRGINADEINLFLQSVDCMKEMLQLIQAGENAVTETSESLKVKFTQILEGVDPKSVSVESAEKNVSEVDDVDSDVVDVDTEEVRWSISFRPNFDILKTGNDPIRLIRELSELGEVNCVTHSENVPNFSSIHPEECYFHWDITVKANTEEHTIREVFEWVEDDAEITITREDILSVKDEGHERLPIENGWSIEFSPHRDTFKTGNDPYKMFAALQELGELISVANVKDLPGLSSLEEENCYLSWTLYLANSETSIDKINSVFEWVEEDSFIHIKKIVDGKLFDVDSYDEKNDRVADNSKSCQNTSDAGISPLSDVNKSDDSTSDSSTSSDNIPSSNVTKISQPKSKPRKTAAESSSIRVGIDKVDSLINMVGELVITQSMLGQLGSEFNEERIPKLMEGLSQLEQNTRELQESVMRIRMLPISFAFSRFPRMVRDLSQTLGKSIHLEMLGEQTELDKTVMEKIGDPLVHLVRNAVDHGIETPEEREAVNKPSEGNITLNAYHQGGNVVIEIQDDGKGLDPQKLKERAISKGIISQSEADVLSKDQLYELIFQPGFSTAQSVTDVSGRGVGMDVVKKNIQALNGTVEIVSELGKGSKIIIRLPLTLAILDGQLVRVGESTYVFPLISIVESMQCKQEFVSKVAGGCDVFKLRDDYVPIVKLSEAFSIQSDSESLDNSLMVVVESEGDKVGIIVDELLAQQQVVIKSLEENYHKICGVSGATILGTGTVALIIDIPGVVKLAGGSFKATQAKINAAIAAGMTEQQAAIN